ncbi:entericidin [Shinella zoogloeoides]|jgi:entericidin B|uniref:entericidin domain-containing protein n=1 Tax=Shinella zoogloeoides TaxID=352475 RepID=UPI001F5824FA|nr:entericidin [Shinella zoogloeoides]
MTAKHLARFGIVLTALVLLSACGNTIRGIGRDTANAVDATKDAGHNIARAAN